MIHESSSTPCEYESLVVSIAKSRNTAAYKQLFLPFAPRIKSYLMRFGLDSQKAEDLTQEVMAALWQKAELFDPAKAKVSTWIFHIAKNKYIDHVRKQKYPEVNVDDYINAIIAPDKTDEKTFNRQTVTHIDSAMNKLKPEHQKIIRLSFYKEMSHAEIAKTLSLPLGTVKSRIRTACQKLRKELRDYQ